MFTALLVLTVFCANVFCANVAELARLRLRGNIPKTALALG